MKKNIVSIILILTTTMLVSGCTGSSVDMAGNTIISENINSADNDNIDDLVRIPLNTITTDIRKLEYDADGIIVRYFVVKGKDGNIHTAFDACDVCGGKKGYSQRGTDVVCNNCGRVFRIDDLGTKNTGGGCWPSYLSHTIEQGNVMIKKSELEQGASRFI